MLDPGGIYSKGDTVKDGIRERGGGGKGTDSAATLLCVRERCFARHWSSRQQQRSFVEKMGRPQQEGRKMFDENSGGRCLVFSFELAEDGKYLASKDSSSECPIFKSTDFSN